VLVIAAAGNSGGPWNTRPAYDGVLAIGAVGYDRKRTDYSNYGSQVDLVATPAGNTNVDLNGDSYPDGIPAADLPQHPDQLRFLLLRGDLDGDAARQRRGRAALRPANRRPPAAQVRQALQTTALNLGTGCPANECGNGAGAGANAAGRHRGGPTVTPTPTLTPPPGVTPTTHQADRARPDAHAHRWPSACDGQPDRQRRLLRRAGS